MRGRSVLEPERVKIMKCYAPKWARDRLWELPVSRMITFDNLKPIPDKPNWYTMWASCYECGKYLYNGDKTKRIPMKDQFPNFRLVHKKCWRTNHDIM